MIKSLILATFTGVLMLSPVAVAVTSTAISGTQAELQLDLTIEPGVTEFDVPSTAITIPADVVTDGAVLTVEIPVSNTGSLDISALTTAITGLPGYITAVDPAPVAIASGGNTTIQITLNVGTVPAGATTVTAQIDLSGTGQAGGGATTFSY